jgi:hypothetical protein
MNYLMFIWAEGRPAPEDLAVMQREIPGWVEEMDGRGVRLLGRELRLPETAATVRVRDGETLVTDGPFLETKEFMAGFDLLECADLDEAIEVAVKTPVSWFQTVELRPLIDRVRLGEEASAFGQGDDSAGAPYMLMVWTGRNAGDAYGQRGRHAGGRSLAAGGGGTRPPGPRRCVEGTGDGYDGPRP